jgi:hypothetical protein
VLVDLVDLDMNPRHGNLCWWIWIWTIDMEINVGGIYIVVYLFEPKICWNPRYEILHVCVEILCMYVLKCWLCLNQRCLKWLCMCWNGCMCVEDLDLWRNPRHQICWMCMCRNNSYAVLSLDMNVYVCIWCICDGLFGYILMYVLLIIWCICVNM